MAHSSPSGQQTGCMLQCLVAFAVSCQRVQLDCPHGGAREQAYGWNKPACLLTDFMAWGCWYCVAHLQLWVRPTVSSQGICLLPVWSWRNSLRSEWPESCSPFLSSIPYYLSPAPISYLPIFSHLHPIPHSVYYSPPTSPLSALRTLPLAPLVLYHPLLAPKILTPALYSPLTLSPHCIQDPNTSLLLLTPAPIFSQNTPPHLSLHFGF